MITSKARTRLSPVARTQQLLATAKSMILKHGLQSFTMEALARTANVSSPLVYNYFDSRKDLLHKLLDLEYQAYADSLAEQVSTAESFEAVVRVFVTSNFDHRAPGNLLPILQSQPEIAATIKESVSSNSQQTARFLVNNMAKHYKLSTSQAELLVLMSSGASVAAAEYCARTKGDRQQTIDTVMDYVFSGMDKIARQ